MKNRKGFSLIELLAIIIIIGLILIVALPAVTKLLKNNNNKQYDKYYEVVKAGALRYSEELKDDLGGYSDTGCIEVTINELIEEKIIKEYNEKDITCEGTTRLNNVKGNVSVLVNLTCKNNRGVTTYEVSEIGEGDCIAYAPESGNGDSNFSGTLVEKILDDNDEQADTNIDFSQISSDTNGKGLYYTSTNTEGNKKTYYFRGNVTNNYVSFAGYVWRIVRINEDGSIRLVTQDSIGSSVFNEHSSDNAFVGYMYGISEATTVIGDVNEDGKLDTKDSVLLSQYLAGWTSAQLSNRQLLIADMNYDGSVTTADATILSQVTAEWSYNIDDYSSTARYNKTHANVTDSTIKAYIDDWYEANLKTNYSSYLADAGFCNDRSLNVGLGYGLTGTTYRVYDRLKNNKTPQFKCEQSNDLFTTTTSTKGNKSLDYPIGMLTMDEVAYAGAIYVTSQDTMYLINGDYFWTMSPYQFFSAPSVGYTAMTWLIGGGGFARQAHVDLGGVSVRPVINLKSCTLWKSGNGTSSLPYQISECDN